MKHARHLFLLSFGDRDPMAARLSALGWRVSSARRGEGLGNRFLSSHAPVVVVDMRDNVNEGLAAITELAGLSEQGGIAILALADHECPIDVAARCFGAGATHFLDLTAENADIEQALNFAYRYVEHVRGGAEVMEDFNRLLTASEEKWSFAKARISDNWVSDKLRSTGASLALDRYPVSGFYRGMSAEERQRLRGAMGRLRDGAGQAAVVHDLDGVKVIHHLHDSGDCIHGNIERIAQDSPEPFWTHRDVLSGLRNGSAARAWIRQNLEQDKKLMLIVFGLKNFATINAAYGRSVGDEVMRCIGQRLLLETPDLQLGTHLVARLDGQNFVVGFAGEQNPDNLKVVAEKLIAHAFGSVRVEERTIQLAPRAGLAIAEQSNDEAVLIRRATLALAEAMLSDAIRIKLSGSSEKEILLEQALEGDLAHALERDEITIALQPQMRVDSGQLIGAEALARWQHPKYGFLGAATLFSVAERAGLTGMLSAHIHDLALAIAGRWPESLSFLRISINVTAGDLAADGFVQLISQKAQQHAFAADRLTLEITESDLIANIDSAVDQLRSLQDQGIRIAIDDFGTGYSSLSYLKYLPLDYLKIDSGLTDDISGSQKDQLVVKSIIDLARNLNLSVIAEGVETEAQLATLAEQKCEFFQGFLRSGPLSPDEFEAFALRSN